LHFVPSSDLVNPEMCLGLLNNLPKLKFFYTNTPKDKILSAGNLTNFNVDIVNKLEKDTEESRLFFDKVEKAIESFLHKN
jgi:hypothetical protein